MLRKIGIGFSRFVGYSALLSSLLLSGCGGGGGKVVRLFTPSEAAAMTPAVAVTLIDEEIVALGEKLALLSNQALNVLHQNTNQLQPIGQIQSISPEQIALFGPDRVRQLGLASVRGDIAVSKINFLSQSAWDVLVNDPLQVAAFTPSEIKTLKDEKITAIDVNTKYLTNSALNALSPTLSFSSKGQIQSLSTTQIEVLSPSQVRMIGALGSLTSVSGIDFLNAGAWAKLTSNPSQVSAITTAEVATLGDSKISEIGGNIKFLDNAVLSALSSIKNSKHLVGQIQSITVSQIESLSPAQVRLIGALSTGGLISTAQINSFNAGAWTTLVANPEQVFAITAKEIVTLDDAKILALDVNIKYLNDAALGALTSTFNSTKNIGQIQSISPVQITQLSPAQVGVLANASNGNGISFLGINTFAALNGSQVSVLTPVNMVQVSAARLASLSLNAIAGLQPVTAASLTTAQKSLLTSEQRVTCAC